MTHERDKLGVVVHCRHLAISGAHVVLAVRNVKAAKNLLEEWQSGQEDLSSPLDVEVIPLPHHPSSLHLMHTLESFGTVSLGLKGWPVVIGLLCVPCSEISTN
jgi:hypothetical protein